MDGSEFSAPAASGSSVTLVNGFPDNANPYDTTSMNLFFAGPGHVDACEPDNENAGNAAVYTSKNQKLLQVVIASKGGSIVPGTFTLATASDLEKGTLADGTFYATVDTTNDDCGAGQEKPTVASGGTVTVSAVSVGEISGKLDLDFASGKLNGAFRIPVCSRKWVAPRIVCR